MRIASVLAIALLGTTSLAVAQHAQASVQHYQLDIPRQSLDTALKDLAQQTGLQIGRFSARIDGNAMVGPVKGDQTPEQALRTLLNKTGLEYKIVSDTTIAVYNAKYSTSATTGLIDSESLFQISGEGRGEGSSGERLQLGSQSPPEVRTGREVEVKPEPPTQMAEIIVTAQKRLENIQQVPASVTFVDAGSLADLGAKGLQDYAAYVPGLQIDSAGSPGQTTITLRGIAPLGSGSAVGTYVDDAPLGSSGFYAMANTFQLDLLPYDLKGVEVLRGPQGTLYGASTMGGLVKYVLQKPDNEKFKAAMGTDVSSTHASGGLGLGARGMVNLPLVTGTLALRVSGFYQKTSGFMDNPTRGEHDINDLRQSGGRLALGWTPTSNLEVTLDVMRQKIDSDGNAIVPLDPVTEQRVLGDLETNIGLTEPFHQKTDFMKGSINWTLPFATLTSVTSYNESRNSQSYDVSAFVGNAFLVPQIVNIELHKLTQELRLTSEAGGTLEWMLGGFYTNENVTNDQYVGALAPDHQPIPGLDPLLTASIPSHYRETAVFANATWRLTERFFLGIGMRESRNKQRYRQITGGAFAPGNGGGNSGETVNTYSGSAKYQFSPETMIYARVASGYQPGGPNVALEGVPPSVGPSTLTNYESGIKTQLLGGRLLLDIAAFRIDWKDIQVLASQPDTGTGFLINGGKARSQGIEGSVALKPAKNLLLGLTFAYTKAEFTVDIPELTASKGQRLPHVPRYSASGIAEYKFDLAPDWAARVGGGLRYTGERPSYLFSPVAAPLVYQERSYVALDLIGNLTHDHWSLGLFARNLLDKRAYITKTAVSGVEVFGAVLQPRTIGLSVDYNF